MQYAFDDCVLDTERYELRRAGVPVKLEPKVYKILVYLVQHANRVVTREELLEHVWPEVYVAHTAVARCITAIRQAVGDSGTAQRVIQTRHGQGYCFVAPVIIHDTPVPGAEALRPSFGASTLTVASSAPSTLPLSVSTPVLSPQESSTPSAPMWSASDGERKLVTALCALFSPLSRLMPPLDLDHLHEFLEVIEQLVQNAIQPYEGALQHLTSDRLEVLFGVPQTHEDHVSRAVLAAVALQQQWQELPRALDLHPETPLTLRVGIHTGSVVVGRSRNVQLHPAAVIGEVPDLAAVLAQHAAPGTILLSTAAASSAQEVVRLEAVPPVPVEGHTTPLVAYRVLTWAMGPGARAGQRERLHSPFVGRAEELMVLHSRLARAIDGQGQVVAIVGEPGIGKSRLLYEFRQQVAGQPVTYLASSCPSYGQTTPYLPLLMLLRQWCGLTDADDSASRTMKVCTGFQNVGLALDPWAPFVLHLLEVSEGPVLVAGLALEERRRRTFEALHQVFLHGSQHQPLVLEVENLHWMDATSEAYLAALTERLRGARIFILVSCRSGTQPAWLLRSTATQIALSPLPANDSQQVVHAILRRAAHATSPAPQIIAKAEGNPFFLEELARVAVEQEPSAAIQAVPDTIQAVLAARLDRLPPMAKRVLQTVAVIGPDVPLPLLRAVVALPEAEIQETLQHLWAAELLYETRLVPEPVYTFKHVLTQEAAYQSLLRRTRQQLHTRIAQVIEAQFPELGATQPERLAHHYTAAGLSTQAITYWQRAGQHAVERSANVEAISHFTAGLDLLKTLPATPERAQQELTLQLAIGSPLLMLKGHTAPEVEHAYTRAYELAQQLGEETPQRFSALVGVWRFYLSQARLPMARELAEQCFALAQRLREPASIQEAHINLGSTLLFMGELVAAHEHLEQGMALYASQQSGTLAFSRGTDPGVVCLSRVAWVLWWLGYPDQALARSHEVIVLAQRLSHPYSLCFALQYSAILHLWCREVGLAKVQIEAAMALMRENGFVQFWGGGMARLGWSLVEQGAVEEGTKQILQGLDAESIHGVELGRHEILAILAQAYGKAGQATEGLRVLADAIHAAHHNAERHCEAELYRLKGELLLQAGLAGRESVKEAETCFRQALDVARYQQAKSLELRAAMSLARLWQAQGKRTEAYQTLMGIYGWFTEGFDTADLKEAQVLLESLA